MYPTQNVLFSFRLQIGWVSLPEHLLRIVFNLLRTVGDHLHHYLMSIDDRMIGFLQGISMGLPVKCYWKYPGKIASFIPETLLTFQHLESFDRILLIYFWESRIQFTDWDIYVLVLACRCLQKSWVSEHWGSTLHNQADRTGRYLLRALSGLTGDIAG